MKRININISEELKKKIKQYCLDNDITVTDLVLKLLKKEIEK